MNRACFKNSQILSIEDISFKTQYLLLIYTI